MSVSDYAAWWGAAIATLVFIWELVKWKRSGPKLKTRISYKADCWRPDFVLFTTNVGDSPATILSARIRLYERRGLLRRKKEIDTKGSFGLNGINGYPALTLAPGEPWEVVLCPVRKVPPLQQSRTHLVIEVMEAHRRKPYVYQPNPENVGAFLRQIDTVQSKEGFGGWSDFDY